MSKIAYLSIPEFERRNLDRVKLVPCEAYQEIVRQGLTVSVSDLTAGADLPIVFEISTRQAVAVGLMQDGILFVTVRGTQKAYDWLTNLDARKTRFSTACGTSGAAHQGFFAATEEILDRLIEEVSSTLNVYQFKKIVFSGHSLGGAIVMALSSRCSICTSSAGNVLGSTLWDEILNKARLESYTFGQPRLFTGGSTRHLTLPNVLVRSGDIVPGVPPEYLGYWMDGYISTSDSSVVYELEGDTTVKAIHWITGLLSRSGVKDHNIELYMEDLFDALGE
ncbi:lipase family protein [Shimia ponticola]|uniref:lipase family protein n=1 Tax=Shimia ponticola TaxID=2582893 RepID=UPI00164CD757|nr:lipase family protein [Shimia ponticola]